MECVRTACENYTHSTIRNRFAMLPFRQLDFNILVSLSGFTQFVGFTRFNFSRQPPAKRSLDRGCLV